MKQIFLFIFFLITTASVFAQFTDTAALNQYIKETLRDRRPTKVSVEDIQKAFLGAASFIGTGGGTQKPDTLTREEADDRVIEGTLVPGKMYCITNADPDLYGGTAIVLKALSKKQFSADGVGYFYNPNYHNEVYGIWIGDQTEVNITNSSGFFVPGEYIYTGDGRFGTWAKPGFLLTSDATGAWNPEEAVTIYGGSYGGSADIEIVSMPQYAIGDKVIWGGKVWTNISGNRGYYNNEFELNTEDWEVEPFTSPEYTLAIDPIKYDWDRNVIIGRKEEAGNNEVYASYRFIYDGGYGNPVKYFQWGNPYEPGSNMGIGSQRIINAFNNNINFAGHYQKNIDMREGSFQMNMYFFFGSGQEDVKMRKESGQSNLFFFDAGRQEDINLTASQQYMGVIEGTTQYQFTFIDAYQHNFTVFNGQSNINLWDRNWDRENAVIIESEGDIFKLPNIGLTARQVEVLIQNYDVNTIYQSPEQVTSVDLGYEMEAGMNYAFEYDLIAVGNMPPNTMQFHLNVPDADRKYIKYTFYNQTTGVVTHSASTTSGDGSMPIDTQGDLYHVKITGSVLNSVGGPVTFSFNPETGPYGGGITVYGGSHARFTKAAWISSTPPPR